MGQHRPREEKKKNICTEHPFDVARLHFPHTFDLPPPAGIVDQNANVIKDLVEAGKFSGKFYMQFETHGRISGLKNFRILKAFFIFPAISRKLSMAQS
jgi:hypothetical protein